MRLLDLFCGAGGCSVGYHRAGFEVVGVDIDPQPNYPFEFHEADALVAIGGPNRSPYRPRAPINLRHFDAIHASPPCQGYSHTARLHGRDDHSLLLGDVRELLEATGLPYVIENVEGAPLEQPITLCGSMFGLDVKRHRLFESSLALMAPACQHDWRNRYPTHARKDKAQFSPVVHVYGTGGGAGKDIDLWRRTMEVPWMGTKAEIAEAIPPAYTELIGHQLMQHLKAVAA